MCGHALTICMFHTASGIKQLFPEAKVIVIKETSYPIVSEALGIKSFEEKHLPKK